MGLPVLSGRLMACAAGEHAQRTSNPTLLESLKSRCRLAATHQAAPRIERPTQAAMPKALQK